LVFGKSDVGKEERLKLGYNFLGHYKRKAALWNNVFTFWRLGDHDLEKKRSRWINF